MYMHNFVLDFQIPNNTKISKKNLQQHKIKKCERENEIKKSKGDKDLQK